MIPYAHSAQELDELTLDGSGWPSLQHRGLEMEKSPGIENHPSNFLAPDTNFFERTSHFDTSSLPAFMTHNLLEPFPCIDSNMSLHFADLRLHQSFHDSGYATLVSSPASGELDGGSRSAVNNHHLLPDSPSVSSPLQKAFSTMQGNNDIAEIGAVICSLVADHLKQLSGLSTTKATTTPCITKDDRSWAPDTKTSEGAHIDPQNHRLSPLHSRTEKLASSGLDKQKRDRVTRYSTTKICMKRTFMLTILERTCKERRRDFSCSHPGCTTKALSSRRNLLRHEENVHSTPVVLACGSKQKYRRDNFVRHLRNCHKCQQSSS